MRKAVFYAILNLIRSSFYSPELLMSKFRVLPLVAAVALAVSLSACNKDEKPAGATAAAGAELKAPVVVATVDGTQITDRDLMPLIQGGMDRANATDRAINRAIAANLAKKSYAKEVEATLKAAETEIAANVYAANRMNELLKSVTDADIEQRYNANIKDADFNGYQIMFAMYGTEDDARAGRADAVAGKADALKAFQPVAADKDGKPAFIGRSDIPYNLGVFVAKLKEGEFTEPAVVRNGVIVLQAKKIKANAKPSLDSVKEILRRTLADERLARELSEARQAATVTLK